MLIDSHCHLDAAEFDHDREQVIVQAGVAAMVVPAVERANFSVVRDLAHRHPSLVYALGIHPMYVQRAADEDLDALEQALDDAAGDPQLVAVGEIGLDYFVPEIRSGAARERQWRFYEAQLRLARRHDLPVILHVRRSQDDLLKGLRRLPVNGGIAHAFNGSEQQAQSFRALGFCLGFGGAMTYPRALQIRRLASACDAEGMVLETDAPDIAPQWLHQAMRDAGLTAASAQGRALMRNTPAMLPGIAQCLAQLRGVPVDEVIGQCAENTWRVLPRLKRWMASRT